MDDPGSSVSKGQPGGLREVALLFFRLGLTAFGGPAAHIAMFRDEVVTRRKWLSDAEFLDLLAATNLIPGPNSTEMTMHLGHARAGWPGLIAGGAAFITPAFFIVLGVSVLYGRYGQTPTAQWLLYGIQPVVIAIILQAIWGLSRSAVKTLLSGLVAVAAFGLYFLHVNELIILFGGGLLVMVLRNGRRLLSARGGGVGLWMFLPIGAGFKPAPTIWLLQNAVPVTLTTLFFTFLKIGAVLYGSGYVLVAFLQTEFVDRLGWITSAQLLDAVAIGQFTPGPVFTTATFIGYLVAGVPGAVVATVGIFLPSFILVAVTNPFIPRLRQSPWPAALLDGLVAASLGLMAAVSVELGRQAIIDIPTIVIALASVALLIRFRVNSTWLIVGGALVGVVLSLLGVR